MAEELPEFSRRGKSLCLGDVAGNGKGGPALLRDKPVLPIGKRRRDAAHVGHPFHGPLPREAFFVVLFQALFSLP